MKNGGWIREKSRQLPKPKTLAEFFKEANNVWIDSDPRQVTWEFDPGKKGSVREIERDQIKFTFFDLDFHCITIVNGKSDLLG